MLFNFGVEQPPGQGSMQKEQRSGLRTCSFESRTGSFSDLFLADAGLSLDTTIYLLILILIATRNLPSRLAGTLLPEWEYRLSDLPDRDAPGSRAPVDNFCLRFRVVVRIVVLFLDPHYSTAPNLQGPQTGTTSSTTPQNSVPSSRAWSLR